MRGLKFIAPAFVVIALAPALSESASAASDPTGIWMNDTGRGAVEIKPAAMPLCGNVVWVKNPRPTPTAAASRSSATWPRSAAAVWDNGWIYSTPRRVASTTSS